MTKKYRKKALIEAVQVQITNNSLRPLNQEFPDWIRTAILKGVICSRPSDKSLYIKTLEGDMTISPGDWIARGVKGELYPIKAAVFAESYEEVIE